MENKTIARPYAKAAFIFALESKKVSEWSVMLEVMAFIIKDVNVKKILGNPSVSRQKRSELLISIAEGYIDDYGKNFIEALAEKNRIVLFGEIYKQFEILKSLNENYKDVTVYSAYSLTEEQKTSLSVKLSKQFSAEVKLTEQIDKSLIGGVLIKTDDLVIDYSIKGRLNKLASSLNR